MFSQKRQRKERWIKGENVVSAKHSVLKTSGCRKTNILVKVQSKGRG